MFPRKQRRLSFDLEEEYNNIENNDDAGGELFPPRDQMVVPEGVVDPPMDQEVPEGSVDNIEPISTEGDEALKELPNNVVKCVQDVANYVKTVAEELKNDQCPNKDTFQNSKVSLLERELTKPIIKKQPNPRPKSPEVQEATGPFTGEVDVEPGEILYDQKQEYGNPLLLPNNECFPFYDDDSRDSYSTSSSLLYDSSLEDELPISDFPSDLLSLIQEAESSDNAENTSADSDSNEVEHTLNVWFFDPIQESDVSSTTPGDEN